MAEALCIPMMWARPLVLLLKNIGAPESPGPAITVPLPREYDIRPNMQLRLLPKCGLGSLFCPKADAALGDVRGGARLRSALVELRMFDDDRGGHGLLQRSDDRSGRAGLDERRVVLGIEPKTVAVLMVLVSEPGDFRGRGVDSRLRHDTPPHRHRCAHRRGAHL